MREFTIVVPTWNMGRHLRPLFESIVKSEFAHSVHEVIFACEKSNDGSEQTIAELIAEHGSRLPKVRMVQPEGRRGAFYTRYAGARAATTPRLFFIDSRIRLTPETGHGLIELSRHYAAMAAHIDIDIKKNVYCLYWQRSHDRFYRREQDVAQVTSISDANIDRIPLGTGCFFCSREVYLRLSDHFAQQGPLFSDDTLLLADLVKVEPLTMHPQFRATWEPRDRAWAFLTHLFKRGPGLAQYHFFTARGALFYATLCAVIYGLLILVLAFTHPVWSMGLALAALVAFALSTALIARSPSEFLRLAPLHTAVLVFYGFGALRGAWVVWRQRT